MTNNSQTPGSSVENGMMMPTNNNGSIQLVPIGDIHVLENWRNMGLVPLQAISLPAEFNTIETNNSNTNASKPQAQQPLQDLNRSNDNLTSVQSGATFKLLDGSCLLSNGALSQSSVTAAPTTTQTATTTTASTNIYSIDSETGTLKPLIITSQRVEQTSSLTLEGVAQNGLTSPPQHKHQHVIAESTSSDASLAIVVDNSTKNDDTTTKSVAAKPARTKPLSLEEMSLNELREECVKRNLPKSGRPKQKLVDRIKEHMLKSNNYTIQSNAQTDPQLFIRQQSATKSPDSGVNMDGSPSFMSCKIYFFCLNIPFYFWTK